MIPFDPPENIRKPKGVLGREGLTAFDVIKRLYFWLQKFKNWVRRMWRVFSSHCYHRGRELETELSVEDECSYNDLKLLLSPIFHA